jgi:hypothetical protein
VRVHIRAAGTSRVADSLAAALVRAAASMMRRANMPQRGSRDAIAEHDVDERNRDATWRESECCFVRQINKWPSSMLTSGETRIGWQEWVEDCGSGIAALGFVAMHRAPSELFPAEFFQP